MLQWMRDIYIYGALEVRALILQDLPARLLPLHCECFGADWENEMSKYWMQGWNRAVRLKWTVRFWYLWKVQEAVPELRGEEV